jgi:hypothetical protein
MRCTMLNHLRVSAVICGSILLIGCAPDRENKPTSLRERQDAALRDPYGYKPDMSDNSDVSGGGLFDFDKDAMRKDVNRVFNP